MPRHTAGALGGVVCATARRADARAGTGGAGATVQGGSTITQQYIKNVLLNDSVTLERKAEEAGLALQLEETLTKVEIFERYANPAFFGEGAYGVEAAHP